MKEVASNVEKFSDQQGNCNTNSSQLVVKCDGYIKSDDISSGGIGSLVDQIIAKSTKKGKTVIKLEIEISPE